MKNLKNIYYIGVLIVILIFILLQYYFKLVPNNNENEQLYKKIKKIEINSIITRKSIDYNNHGAAYIVYGKDSLPTHTGWDEQIEIGDSIIKPKNSLKLLIKNSSKKIILDYKSNDKEILTTDF